MNRGSNRTARRESRGGVRLGRRKVGLARAAPFLCQPCEGANPEKLPAVRSASRPAPAKLLNDLRNLIESTRSGVAQAVNSALVVLYWQVGQRIRTDVLKSKRATYGDEICSTPSNELAVEFGNGYSRPNLTRMIRFTEVFRDR